MSRVLVDDDGSKIARVTLERKQHDMALDGGRHRDWRNSARTNRVALYYVIVLCQREEQVGWWAAFKMTRRYMKIYGTWPEPTKDRNYRSC
jgi:hypothetical protein